MAIIGRKKELQELQRLAATGRAELLVVYGRRRVGKTFLIREYYRDSFAFYTSGVANGSKQTQLRAFRSSLRRCGVDDVPNLDDWFDAFERLRDYLESGSARRDPESGRLVVFIDELPWLDTPKSDFMPAFDYFWNTWASARNDVLVVVCGSATSWIVEKLLQSKGGFHNRVTARMHLEPFTLNECEQLMRLNGFTVTRQLVAETYMTFGGIPYYLQLMDPRLGLARDIDRLCFESGAPLRVEFGELYQSLFKKGQRHIGVVRALAQRRSGLTRDEIAKGAGLTTGGQLTETLVELEQCGFIRRYRDITRRERDPLFQLVDPFTLFWLRFVEGSDDSQFWQHNYASARVRAWHGLAFEMLCLAHVAQIKRKLGVEMIAASICSWRSKGSDPGAQIDLVIDRADGIVNLCEMKWAAGPYAITKGAADSMTSARETFAAETRTRKAQHLTLVTPHGAKRNEYWGLLQNEVTLDDLFEP